MRDKFITAGMMTAILVIFVSIIIAGLHCEESSYDWRDVPSMSDY